MVRSILSKLRPSRAIFSKMLPVCGMVAVGIAAYVVGRASTSRAQPSESALQSIVKNASQVAKGYDGRVVAYIHENIPITREELGEFLIARFGVERLDFLVSRRIVEEACKSRGIAVTDAQVEAQLRLDLAGLKMDRKDFVNIFLKRYNKTLYEWKEDVIRPKLMMAALVEPTIQVTEEDLRKGFEGRYGPKVECRWIVLPNDNHKGQVWAKVKDNEVEFDRAARQQGIPELAQVGGKAPCIHMHFGDANIEKIAFGMREGEVSQLIQMPDKSWVILKCDKRVPADQTKRFEVERLALEKEIRQFKLQQEITETVAKLRKQANPKLLLTNETRQDDLERAVLPEIRGQAMPALPNSTKLGG